MKVGIICDLDFSRHPQFKSYYYALETLYGKIPILVKDKKDLVNLDLLIIGDDHYDGHKKIIEQPGFINVCNTLNIPVVVLTTERIFDSFFAWNIDNYNKIKQFKNLHHYTADVDDCEKLGTGIHRISISKKYKDIYKIKDKKNAIIFVGSTRCKMGSYDERRRLLEKMKKEINLEIIDSGLPAWEDYIRTIAQYRFVFSPLGNGNFLPTRFYETLAVGSIPVQQVRHNTLKYYDIESNFKDCIFFEDEVEVKYLLKDYSFENSTNELWTEDNLKMILKKEGFL